MNKLKNKGFSIIENIVAIGVLAIALSLIMTMMFDIQKNRKNIEYKLNTLDVESAAQALLSRKEDCSCQFKGKTFDATNPNYETEIQKLNLSCAVGAGSFITTDKSDKINLPTYVQRMYLGSFKSTSNGNEFITEFNIASEKKSSFTFKSTPIALRVYTNPDSPDTNKEILGCGNIPVTVPKNLIAKFSNRTCDLSWDESLGAKPISYLLKFSTTKGNAKIGSLACAQSGSRTCRHRPLVNGVPYYYTVRASNSYGFSDWSSETECIPSLPPSPPVLSVSFDETSCDLTWNQPAGTPPITYTVYQSASSPATTSSSVVCSNISGNSCKASGLTEGQTYYFAANAKNVNSTSNLSSTVICTPQKVKLANLGINGDCVYADCGSDYIIGCSITLGGGDGRGCVSVGYNGKSAFFKEGDKCKKGYVSGALKCGSIAPNYTINNSNCPMNKPYKIYPGTGSPAGCP